MTRTLDRRDFLRSLGAGGGLLLGVSLSGPRAVAAVLDGEYRGAPADFQPHQWLRLAPDGTLTIVASRSEMGTGIRTALPMVVADEMGADWDRVVLEQAPGDPKYGSQNTDGSRSVRQFTDRMRTAGAGRARDADRRRRGALVGASGGMRGHRA